jgi:hypothetical protein
MNVTTLLSTKLRKFSRRNVTQFAINYEFSYVYNNYCLLYIKLVSIKRTNKLTARVERKGELTLYDRGHILMGP